MKGTKMLILLMLCTISALSMGCAWGINHNVATINGKPYLVESRNRTFLYIIQWSDDPQLHPLENALDRDMARKYFAEEIKAKCLQDNSRGPLSKDPVELYDQMQKCIKDKLAKQ